jgi:hypothetical protein
MEWWPTSCIAGLRFLCNSRFGLPPASSSYFRLLNRVASGCNNGAGRHAINRQPRTSVFEGPGDHLRVEGEAFGNQFPEKRFVVSFFLLERRAALCLAQGGHGDQVGVKLRGGGGYFERREVTRFGGDVFVKEFFHADVIGTELEKLEVDTARLLIAGTEPELSLKAKNPAEAGFGYVTRRVLLMRPTLL